MSNMNILFFPPKNAGGVVCLSVTLRAGSPNFTEQACSSIYRLNPRFFDLQRKNTG